jgi:hypothetical protein
MHATGVLKEMKGVIASHRLVLTATALAALAAISANAQTKRFPHQAGPSLLRLEGYVGNAPAGARAEAHLVLQYEGKNHAFDLTEMAVVTGDRSYSQVLQQVSPYEVSFFLRGSGPAVTALTNAARGQKLVLLGYNRVGSRDLMLAEVKPAAADPTPTH